MSLLYKSPMPKKSRLFFFVWTVTVMGLFALAGIQLALGDLVLGVVFFVGALLMAGFGFMIRKRVMRALGQVKPE